jgi:hypothetical protein
VHGVTTRFVCMESQLALCRESHNSLLVQWVTTRFVCSESQLALCAVSHNSLRVHGVTTRFVCSESQLASCVVSHNSLLANLSRRINKTFTTTENFGHIFTFGVGISAENEAVSFRATPVQYNALLIKNRNYFNFYDWRLLFGFLCAALWTPITLTLPYNYVIYFIVLLLLK